MLRRGVRTARRADVFEYRGGPFDTLVMLGHGIGIVEDLAGLRRFLTHAKKLVKPTGQLLVDSLDVSRSREPEDLAYQEAKRKADRYRGEMVMQIEFGDTKGPFCGWLHVDPGTLEDHAMETIRTTSERQDDPWTRAWIDTHLKVLEDLPGAGALDLPRLCVYSLRPRVSGLDYP